jgi:hypothetical protein
MRLVKKPGFGRRAFAAFLLLDAIAAAIMLALIWLLRPYMEYWYVILPITLGFLVSQFVILNETIWPVLKDWITQEEYVSDETRK